MCTLAPGEFVFVRGRGQKGREEYCPSALLAWRKEAVEVGRREKEKEVPVQRSECEGNLRLVSSSRLFQRSNASSGSLSLRVIFTVIILSEEEKFLCRFRLCLCNFIQKQPNDYPDLI